MDIAMLVLSLREHILDTLIAGIAFEPKKISWTG
jgi:hypothetical protein